MAITADSIADDSSTMPANAEEAPKDTSGLPPEILEMPIFKGILEGSPGALWTPTGDKSHEAVTAVKNGKALNEVGIFFFRDKPSGLDLIYNAQYIDPSLVEAAAKKGKLKEIAQPLAETVAAFNGAAGVTPVAKEGESLPAAGAPSSVPVDSALNTQRVNNLSPQGPTTGPLPGAGRILNSIATPTV